MPQILIQPSDISGEKFSISGKEAHHLLRVLRKKEGQEIFLADGQGHRYRAIITNVDLSGPVASGHILEKILSEEKPFSFHLYQGLPKGAKFDFVVEKASELGVDSITPFLSKKSLIRLDQDQIESKRLRWERLAEAACKQSNQEKIPIINPAIHIDKIKTSDLREGLTLIPSEYERKVKIKDALSSSQLKNGAINFFVGPESGFTPEEVEMIVKLGGISVSLGNHILRTETVGLIMLSILKYQFEMF